MIVSQQIKELVSAHFNVLPLIPFANTVKISATAPFPDFPFLFYKPNNCFFLCRCVHFVVVACNKPACCAQTLYTFQLLFLLAFGFGRSRLLGTRLF